MSTLVKSFGVFCKFLYQTRSVTLFVLLFVFIIIGSGCAMLDDAIRTDGGDGLSTWGKILMWLGGLLLPAVALAGSHEITKTNTSTHRDTYGRMIGTSEHEVGTGQFTEPMPILGLIWMIGYLGYWLFYGWWV